jgi:hypothetical protein
MSRKSSARTKKRSASKVKQRVVSVPKQKWSRSDIITIIGIVVAIVALVISLTVPEVRQFIGLDHPALASKPVLFPHLWRYYDGYELQDSAHQKKQYLSLTMYWQTPVASSVGTFEAKITVSETGPVPYNKIPESCTFSGSMRPPVNNAFTFVTFLCSFSQNATYTFTGNVYSSDGHISGTVTNVDDPNFLAHWYFTVMALSGNALLSQQCWPNDCYSVDEQRLISICEDGNCPYPTPTPFPMVTPSNNTCAPLRPYASC